MRAGRNIELHNREFQLLEYMLANAGRTLTRGMILERVWELHFDPKTNVVETHMSRLRAKIDGPFKTKLIQTVKGTGYRISDGR